MSLHFGENTYRQGALERIEDARRLLHDQRLAAAVYLSGRAVEGMLRALLWRKDADIRGGRKSLETGHDLRELLRSVARLGLLAQGVRDQELLTDVQKVARLWLNNLRFASTDHVARYWRHIGEVTAKRSIRQAAMEFYNACATILKRCEQLWQD